MMGYIQTQSWITKAETEREGETVGEVTQQAFA